MYLVLLESQGYLLVMDTKDSVVTKIRKNVFKKLDVQFKYEESLLSDLVNKYSKSRIMNYSSYILDDFSIKYNNSNSEIKLKKFIDRLLVCIEYKTFPKSYYEYSRYLSTLSSIFSIFRCKLNTVSINIIPYSSKFMDLVFNKKDFIMGDISEIHDTVLSVKPGGRGRLWRRFIIDKDVYIKLFRGNKEGLCDNDIFSLDEFKGHIYSTDFKFISNKYTYEDSIKVKSLEESENIQDLLTRDINSLYDIVTKKPYVTKKNFYYKDGDIISMEVDFDILTTLDESIRKNKILEYKDKFISVARNLLEYKMDSFTDIRYKVDFKYYNCTKFIYRRGLSQVTIKFELRKDILKLKNDLQSSAVQDYKNKHYIV